MTALAAFCLASVVFLVWRDLFLPRVRDVEVWLGFEVQGTAARMTAPLHWALFLVGAWGFWTQRRWILPCAAAYAFYVALSHLIWNVTSPVGRGWLVGFVQLMGLSVPGVLLLYAHRWERRRRAA
jgi:hypothetical protein